MKISIITVNKDNSDGLRRTIESVISQTAPPYEFIIIDGASVDNSPLLLSEFSKYITYSVSEPDKGIYNAMNKGVSVATGEWCLFLNSGDMMCNENVLASLQDSGCDSDIVCGSTLLMTDPPIIKEPHREVTLLALYSRAICHQSALIRTTLLRKHPYDESLKIVSDRKFFLESLILDGCSYSYVDLLVAEYDMNGYSSKNPLPSSLEWQNVLSEYIPKRILIDYGRQLNSGLYVNGSYELFFIEISRRRYKKIVYQMVRCLLLAVSCFIPSAGFAKMFPRHCE